MSWKPDGPQGNESAKIKYEIVPYTRGKGLDLGCGPHKTFPHFRGIDSNIDAQLFGIQATGADFIIPTCEVLDDFPADSIDEAKETLVAIKQGMYICMYVDIYVYRILRRVHL
jgi:hypothetical protein